MSPAPSANSGLNHQIIGSRYRVESALGEGGMATVFRALDLVAQRTVAVKVLSNSTDAQHRLLFEREFHTLAGLRHPNVVEAYEYGIDACGAYYSMELLDGEDLHARAPLAWPEACRVLRDVTSALALLHARKLVHRDLSHRNVWITRGGQTKIIDFGALTSFGNASEVMGTAPFVAPEAVVGKGLDQRTDLFAVGALGYWMLTGVHAYSARRFAELSDAWARSLIPPSARVRALARSDLPAVPEDLDALIAALLSQKAADRPVSAAEVLDRVSAIAELRSDRAEGGEAGAYLLSTAFVGRVHERRRFRRALEDVTHGHGTALFIDGPPGVGRTRLLNELAHDARFARCVVLHAETSPGAALHSYVLAVAHQLLDALPAEAHEAAQPHAPILGHLSSELRARLCGDRIALAEMPEAPGEVRMRAQAALLQWFLDIRSDRPIVILVDDVQALDGGSGGWLASLARECSRRKLLIATTFREVLGTSSNYVVQSLRHSSRRIALRSLSEEEVLELTRSMFGEAVHLRRIATFLWQRSGGIPAHAMDLAEHMVVQGLARYRDGAWVLPQELDAAALPADRPQIVAAKLARLTSEARELARQLSVHDGILSLPQCRSLSELAPERLFEALQSLVSGGVLIGAEGGYRFVQQETRTMLATKLEPEQRKRAHRALGAALLDQAQLSTVDRLRSGLHLMLGGETDRGSRLVSEAAIRLGTVEYADTGLVCNELDRAVRLFREAGFRESELLPLLCAAAQSGYYGERRFAAQHGEDAIAALQRILQFPLALRLRPYFGRRLSLIVAIAYAAISLGRGRRASDRVPALRDVVRLFVGCISALTGIATICIDPASAARYAAVVEPLTALGKDHAATLLHEFCVNLSLTVQDRPRESIERWDRFLQRVESPRPIRDLPSYARVFYLGGALYARGVVECWRESSHALEIADRLESLTLRLYSLSADQLRAFYHAIQGNIELYEHYRERVEIHAIQRGTAWQVEIWAPAAMITAHLRTGDAMRMKQCMEQLRPLYTEVASLALYAVRARGVYALLRNTLHDAVPLLEKVLEEKPLAVIGWARQHGALARAYNEIGEHVKAKDVCERALAQLGAEDRDFTAMNLGVQIEHARALAGLGRHREAAESLQSLLQRHAQKGNVTRGLLHDALAHVAALGGDEGALTLHLEQMRHLYAETAVPSLIERGRKVCQRLRPQGAVSNRPSNAATDLAQEGSPGTANDELPPGAAFAEVAAWTLRRLANQSKSANAYLFQRTGDRVECVMQLSASCSSELQRWVAERVAEEQRWDELTEITDVTTAKGNPNLREVEGWLYRAMILRTSRNEVYGAIVLDAAAIAPDHEVLTEIADRLADA